jgi:periplasmic divalent cation tolerance protein
VAEDVCEIVVTGSDAEWLSGYTRTLVEERLVACGHQFAAIRSVYRWEGAVHDEPEARVALHTRRSLVPAITARADELHPYDVPCVIALPLADGNPAYLAWVAAETRDP